MSEPPKKKGPPWTLLSLLPIESLPLNGMGVKA